MFEKHILKNKIRLLTTPIKDSNTATILVMVKVGSRYETPNLAGASHYIEHLMFKGTTKRPNTLLISKELDALGAQFNAFTSKEYTGYYVKCNKKHFSKACDILFDMLNDSLFDPTEMEREKKVIVEEIHMYHDNPLMHIDDVAESLMYDGNELGLDIAGTTDSVLGYKRDEVLDYYRKTYSAENVVVTVGGGISDDMIKEITDKFEQYKNVEGSPNTFNKGFWNYEGPQLKRINRQTNQSQMILSLPAFGYDDKRSYALRLMSVILGGNMSSRLFINIRERQGLCYVVRSWVDPYKDVGALKVQAGLDKSRIRPAIESIKNELLAFTQKKVDAEELQRAKDYLEGKMTLSLEDSQSLASWYAKQELLKDSIVTPEQATKLYNDITAEDIFEVAQDIIKENLMKIAVIGPFDKDSDII